MNHLEARTAYKEFTLGVTIQCRRMALGIVAAAAALPATGVEYPLSVKLAMVLGAASLIVDIVQYAVTAHRASQQIRAQEVSLWTREQTLEGEYHFSSGMDRPGRWLWWTKQALLALAFVCLAGFVML